MDTIAEESTSEPLLSRSFVDDLRSIAVRDRAVTDYVPQMIWIVAEGTRRLLYANARYRTYFGVEWTDWDARATHFHADDLAIVHIAFETVRSNRHPYDSEVRLLGRDGRYRWHKVTLAPVTQDGEIAEWVVTALDVDDMITARQDVQEAKDLFSLSQQAAGAGVWDLDLRSGAVKLSRESARLHDIGDHPVAMDLDEWRRVVDAEDAEKVLEALQRAVETKTTFSGEFRVRRAGADVRWISGIGRAYYEQNGDPVRMIGLNFDITDRKTAEARLLAANVEAEEARREAERASGAKSDFLASMSHEIRTPLNSIIGYTDLLMEDAAHGSPLRHKLEIVQESGAALLTVVNDILDFSKIEAGQIELDLVVFSPRALLDHVVAMMADLARRKGIDVTRRVSLAVPDRVLGDEGRLRQILVNLVNNAIKFTDAGHVAIDMDCERRAGCDAFELIRLSVADTGIGLSPEQQTRLFRRFSQVDGSINRRFGGSGLGLAICRQLVDLMRGEIGVESRLGIGSTFWFRVPLPLAVVPEICPTAPRMRASESAGARVLLVEDIVVNQELTTIVLERAGHVVDVAQNGIAAVEAVASVAYDVVLMDVQMPVMDGIAATQAIRAAGHANRGVPIVAMTANVLPQQIAALKAAGMDDHVGKPFRKIELLAAIDRWTQAKRAAASPRLAGDMAGPVRFDRDAFASLEDMMGPSAFRTIVEKFAADLSSRFVATASAWDLKSLASDAHAVINAAGLLGFVDLVAACRQIETLAANDEATVAAVARLRAERDLVVQDLLCALRERETRSPA